ncbi:MAG TPA: GAF domain-containing sensor histidine kinase [Actinomycetota bacterium]|nr:GAF domain-containing sensor histidine kinase [Actinomycetota bacterium]
MLSSLRRSAYAVLFVVAGVFALSWLLLGALPALGAASDSFHRALHDVAGYGGPLSEISRNAAHASHSVSDQGQVPLDYLFSAFNLGLAVVVIWLKPNHVTARLLAIGLIGTSVAFNLQGHDALQVFPVGWMGPISTVHVWIHIASGLCYVFALLLFPSGGFVESGSVYNKLRPLVVGFVTMFFLALSSITVDDHTTGLVILFGIFIPIAGIASQVGRYRKARTEEQREQSRVLVWGLALALLVAVPLMLVTDSLEGGGKSETVAYEVEIPAEGRYFFRCDPHPEDMRGVVLAGGTDRGVTLEARDNEFDTESITLAAGVTTVVRLTNFDGDLHNVAIYRDFEMTQPIFIGKEFSGSTAGLAAFRVFRVVLLVVPVALLVGLVKFRLWDVNRLLRRALAYGLLVGFITVTYLGIVVGLGSLLGIGRFTPALSIVVMVAVAALFQPLRDRAKRLANRLVYGTRATPYELLSEFSARVGTTPDLEHLVPELARTLGMGTGAQEAEVWLRVGDGLVCAAVWPEENAPRPGLVSMDNGAVPELAGRDRVVPVRYGDELLGLLTITKRGQDEVTPLEDRLLKDAASQTGLALRNVQLTAELQARLSELGASRQRIVAAQDTERRRLERDIHDGAQQHLVALSMKLRSAEDLALRDPDKARAALAELQQDTGEALQALRDLARGIHPPVLSDRGLAAALEAHARRTAVPISVHATGLTRHDPHFESAVYFCCTEAIQNAIKHAGARAIEVDLTETATDVTFVVADDGDGFDPSAERGAGLDNMHDRVAALAGVLTIDSAPGRGTTITGRVPLGR